MIEYEYICDRCQNTIDIKLSEKKDIIKCTCGENMRRVYGPTPWHYKRVWEGSDR